MRRVGQGAAVAEPQFVVLAGAARSGTTLLRLILDAHRDIGCPAEAGIPGLIASLGRVWWTVDADILAEHPADPLGTDETGRDAVAGTEDDNHAPQQNARLPELPAKAKSAIRQAALAPMFHYCERDGKVIYCDKSLDSVYHLEAVRQVFPETRYVLLFRHVMDTVASGIEASPWGFQAYGYQAFVQRSPENFVAALVNYWLSHVSVALRWEAAHPEWCYRVRYEDLVSDPATVVTDICRFLDVEPDPTIADRAFRDVRAAKGPGDYKVTFTSSVDTGSIGQGKRVPVELIPPALLDAANEKLKALGYGPLDRVWNAEPTPANGRDKPDGWAGRLADMMHNVDGSALTQAQAVHSFALVAQDDQRVRWVVDLAAGTIREGDADVDWVVTGTAEDLALLVSGEENAGVLLRSGRIRHLTAHENAGPNVIEAIQFVLDALARQGRRAGYPIAGVR